MDSKRRFLVMDANQRSGLAVARALGAAYPSSVIETADETPTAVAGRSKFASRYHQHPSPSTEPQAFIDWVKDHVCGQFDLVLPTTEVTSQLLLQFKGELHSLPLAFAPIETILQLADKSKLVKSALAAEVPVPNTSFFANLSELNPASLNYPCVLKPSLSKIFTGDKWIATTVRVLHSESDFMSVVETDTYLKSHDFMIQEFIPGHGAGIFCLFNKGQPVQFFAHKRLREKPPEGGVSVLSESVAVDEGLKQHSEKLLRSVGWHGVAMIEFRVSEDGKPYLMEVNTRFWGSLQLAIDSGVNFPVQLVQAHFGEHIEANHHYKIGQRLRWLLGDLDSLYIFLKRSYSIQAKLLRFAQFVKPKLFKQKHEVNRLTDAKPFIEELRQYIDLSAR